MPSGSGQGLAKRRGGGARIRRRRLTDCGPPDGGSRVDCWVFARDQVHELAKLDFGAAEMRRPLFGDEIDLVNGRCRPNPDAEVSGKLTSVINTSSPKGTLDYATLLSIQQTLRYRGREFLEFMRSGEMKIPM